MFLVQSESSLEPQQSEASGGLKALEHSVLLTHKLLESGKDDYTFVRNHVIVILLIMMMIMIMVIMVITVAVAVVVVVVVVVIMINESVAGIIVTVDITISSSICIIFIGPIVYIIMNITICNKY